MQSCTLCLLILILFVSRQSLGQSAGRPNIIPFSAPDSLSVGSRVKLLCSVSSGASPLQLRWLRNGQSLSDSAYPNDSDLSVQQLEDGLILNVRRMSAALNGNYTCQASNRFGASSHSAALFVQAPLKWLLRPNSSVETRFGESLQIGCTVDGYPPPTVQWRLINSGASLPVSHPTHDSSARSAILAWPRVERVHENDYECFATNGLGNDLVARMSLLVLAPPLVETFDDSGQIVSNSRPITIQSSRNGQLNMRCRATGDSPLTIDWMHNGRSLSSSGRNSSYQILMAEHSSSSQRHLSVLSELQILAVNRSHSGAYECIARNSLGSNRLSFNVSVLRQPDWPADVRTFDLSSDSVRVSWQTPFDGFSPLTYIRIYYWLHLPTSIHGDHKLRHHQLSPEKTSFKLDHLRPDTAYDISLAAGNMFGESALSPSILIRTNGKSPTWKASDLTVRRIDHNSMTIDWVWPESANRSLGGSPTEFQLCWRPLDQANFFIERLAWPQPNSTVERSNTSLDSLRMSLRVSALRPNTEYEVKVRALNREGFSPDSDLIRVRTKPAGPPPAPQITSHQLVSKAYLVLRWQPQTVDSPDNDAGDSNGSNDLQLFVVYVERADEHLLAQRVPVPIDQRQITITNLDRAVEYHVSVSAINSNGESALSDPIIISLPYSTTDNRQLLSEKQMITLGIVGIGTSIVLVSMCLCCFQMSRMRSEQNRRLRQILAASHTLSRCGTSKSTTTYASVDGLSTGRPGPWIPPLPDDLMPSFDTRLVCDPTTQHVRVCAADELTGARPLNVPIAGTSTFQPANTHAIPTLTMPASAAHDYESCVYDEALD